MPCTLDTWKMPLAVRLSSLKGTQLVWRCEGLRRAGQHILGCEGGR